MATTQENAIERDPEWGTLAEAGRLLGLSRKSMLRLVQEPNSPIRAGVPGGREYRVDMHSVRDYAKRIFKGGTSVGEQIARGN